MTKREVYAGLAMAGLTANLGPATGCDEQIVEEARLLADMMLEELGK